MLLLKKDLPMRTIGIHTPFGRELSFVELNGSEGLSTLFEYRLVLTSKNPNLEAELCWRNRTTKLGKLSTIIGVYHDQENQNL